MWWIFTTECKGIGIEDTNMASYIRNMGVYITSRKMALKKWLLNEDSISSESFDNAPNRIMELRRLDL